MIGMDVLVLDLALAQREATARRLRLESQLQLARIDRTTVADLAEAIAAAEAATGRVKALQLRIRDAA